ncbi:hypothetical protein MTP99_009322 [Tenebrio molitor]|nr:hypothetical protein MTP99_009322 [Tenebrio molitor]
MTIARGCCCNALLRRNDTFIRSEASDTFFAFSGSVRIHDRDRRSTLHSGTCRPIFFNTDPSSRMKRNDILPLCNTGQVLIQIDIMIGIVVMIIVGFGPVAILSAARSGSIGILPEREQHCCKSLPNVLLKHSMTLRFNAFDTGLRNPFVHNSMTELKLESLEDAVVLEEPETDWLHDKRGCPAYVSPEILKAGAHYSGKAADMWSLGVILYTMLVGRYPFSDSEHASLFAKISRGHFVIPECLSSRARCLIRSLLRREPSERITSDDILYHPWLAKEDREWTSRACDQLVPECNLYD